MDKITASEPSKQAYPFGFPFQPYDIQEGLMKVAYQTYEDSKFALLESPTGTGKSLSLICSALTWLTDNRDRSRKNLHDEKDELESTIEGLKREELDSTDWLNIQTRRQDLNRKLTEINLKLELVTQLDSRREARRHAQIHQTPLEYYSSLTERTKANDQDAISTLAQDILRRTKELDALDNQEEPLDEETLEKKIREDSEKFVVRPKVYYASRTHSQLSQFIHEIKKTRFADANDPVKMINLTPLASRANLCVNPDVIKMKDPSAINEKCTELQREPNKAKRCPYMKAKQVNLLKEHILSSVQDIEDIVKKGRSMGSCPYYATRVTVSEADVVVLPYNNLLHQETRNATSLDLKDSIVIVDEAHNLMETICSIHSNSITGRDLICSHSILTRYYNKFQARLSPRNSDVIKSIVLFLRALIKYLDSPEQHLKDFEEPQSIKLDENGTPQKIPQVSQEQTALQQKGKAPKNSSHEFMMDVTKFIGVANIKPFNVFKIIDYFSRSQLARKLIGFFRQDSSFDICLELETKSTHEIESGENANNPLEDPKLPATKKRKLLAGKQIVQKSKIGQTSLEFLKTTNPHLIKQAQDSSISYPIYTLVEFLKSLTNLSEDGRVLVSHANSDIQRSSLKFILLNPSSQFEQTSKEARSIVLAGGTMQPMEEFFELLFKPLSIQRERINVFSCGHVISDSQLYIASLSTGCSGKPLEMSYKSKSSNEFLDEIGATIRDIASVVPGGMICFFPSYEYEMICYDRWKSNSTISKIETKYKQLFREPRLANQSKDVLEKYSQAVMKWSNSNRGAILFCVVGGKMSEGINFNDDLGRCVVMVGLPYANIKSAELQQKMAYYDRTCSKLTQGQTVSAGQQYYENLCIKGINQSIGRAIRHRRDYAAVILLDRRYSTKTSIRKGLPNWMAKSLMDHAQFGSMLCQLREFYRRMSDNHQS